MASPEEIHALEAADLVKRLGEAREELFRLRVQHATLQLTDTGRLRMVRRDIARMLTIQRERQLSGNGGGA